MLRQVSEQRSEREQSRAGAGGRGSGNGEGWGTGEQASKQSSHNRSQAPHRVRRAEVDGAWRRVGGEGGAPPYEMYTRRQAAAAHEAWGLQGWAGGTAAGPCRAQPRSARSG